MKKPEDTLAPPTGPRYAPISPRAFIIGTLLIPLMCYWVEYTEIVAGGTDLAAMSLIIGAVFSLFVLICFNGLLHKIAPRWAFSQAELLFIYVMQTVSIGVSGIGMMQFLITTLGNAFHYANPANGWEELFHRAIPMHLVPNPEVLPKFYQGNESNWMQYLWGWASPIFWWSAFICVLLGCMLCLNVILRRQWMDNEKLPFPIVYLPLELTKPDPEGGPIWRNPRFWLAFMIPVVLESMASLNYLYPNIPALPLKPSTLPNLSEEIKTPPWSALGNSLTLAFYPMVIGIIYFLPVEVSFSAWFFYLFAKFQDVAATAMGLRADGVPPAMARIPYHAEQGAGAFLAFTLFGFWTYRKYLSAIIGKAFGEKEHAHLDDSEEPIPYRWAVFGFLIGFAILVAFGIYGGMVWWLPIILFGLYFVFATTFTRVRAEAGLPWGYQPWMTPHGMILDIPGRGGYDLNSLTGLAYFQWFDKDYRCLAMPHQLEAMKIANSCQIPSRMNPRHLYLAILWATLIAVISSWWALLSIYYQYGAATGNVNSWRTWVGQEPFHALADWIKNPGKFEIERLYGVMGGAGFTIFLMQMRTQFLWWPFHPVGYVLAETSTMHWLWCPTLVGWLIKLLALRYGGIKGFRAGIPFFIGLILGDYVISCLWALLGLYLGIPTYRAFPI
ncbi:MAG: hypothetical protein OHK0029_07580 [Armatimonadaceae bacterium]